MSQLTVLLFSFYKKPQVGKARGATHTVQTQAGQTLGRCVHAGTTSCGHKTLKLKMRYSF